MVISYPKEISKYEQSLLNIKNAYMIYGEDDYLIEEYVKTLLTKILGKESKDIVNKIDCKDSKDIDDLINIVATKPMFSKINVVLVENFAYISAKQEEEKLILFKKLLSNLSNLNTYLIILQKIENREGEGVKKKKSSAESFAKEIEKEIDEIGYIINFTKFYENQIIRWISERAKKYKINLPQKNIIYFLRKTGENLRHINSELEKISILAKDNLEITPEFIDLMVTSDENYQINELISAIMQKSLPLSLEILTQIFPKMKEHFMIPLQIAKYYINLWECKYLLSRGYFKNLTNNYWNDKPKIEQTLNKISKEIKEGILEESNIALLKKNTYFIWNYFQHAKNFSEEKIKENIMNCYTAELKLKGILSSVSDKKTILELLIEKLSR